MDISVIGCGYLGAVHAASMAKLGHRVIGIDVDAHKVAGLNAGVAPFHEPGLDDLLRETLETGRLRFSTDMAQAADAQVHFIAVGTPQREGSNAADLGYVDAALTALLPHLRPRSDRPTVVVGKSTVPVGTAQRLQVHLATRSTSGALLAWNPEFLREGHAVEDTLAPDRLVYGLPPDAAEAAAVKERLDEVYADLLARDVPLVATDYATAELVKVAANSFLATKISFINAMADLCDAAGGDVTQLADAIGYDVRIGRAFLSAGLGFGGGCLPKDIRAFMARAGELGVDPALTFLREIDGINLRRRDLVVDLALRAVGGDFFGKRVAVLGAAFKPHSDDVRDSPALDVASRIAGRGALVSVTDPAAGPRLKVSRPDLTVADDAFGAAQGADVVLLLTEWPQFRDLDPEYLGQAVAIRRIIDARNTLDPARWRAAGWHYTGLGRP